MPIEKEITVGATTYKVLHTPVGEVREFPGTPSDRTVVYDAFGTPVFHCANLPWDGKQTILTAGHLPEGVKLEDLRLREDQTLSTSGRNLLD